MPELKTAINVVEYIVAFIATLVIGDYLGHKIGRWRLASLSLIAVLLLIVAFAIYAAITLA